VSAPYFYRYTDADVQLALECGEKRVHDAVAVGAVDGFGEDSTESHYHGALGEIAVAAMLKVPWICHSRRWNKPDVGRYEVRAIGPRNKWPEVKTKINDKDNTPIMAVMLVAGVKTGGEIEIGVVMGWTTPLEIRDFGTNKDPGNRGKPSWFARLDILDTHIPETDGELP